MTASPAEALAGALRKMVADDQAASDDEPYVERTEAEHAMGMATTIIAALDAAGWVVVPKVDGYALNEAGFFIVPAARLKELERIEEAWDEGEDWGCR